MNATKCCCEDNLQLDQVKYRRVIFNCGLGSKNMFRPKIAHKKTKKYTKNMKYVDGQKSLRKRKPASNK